jgi:DNA-binding PadR family transcriptional regulator
MREKLLRGLILDFLNRIYPRDIEKLGVIEAFYKEFKPKDIEKALEYLKDKGYVEEREMEHPVRRFEMIRLYKITPRGIDLIEGTLCDNGIAFWEDE